MDEQYCPPQPQYNMPDLGRAVSSGFSSEHYQFIGQLIESKSAREMFLRITQTDLSGQCVDAFFKVITSGFDKNTMLARNDQKQIALRVIDFDIALNLMVNECHESDIQNKAFPNFVENIRQMFRDFVSRSATERDQLLRQEYAMTPQGQPQTPQGQTGIVQGAMRRFGRGD